MVVVCIVCVCAKLSLLPVVHVNYCAKFIFLLSLSSSPSTVPSSFLSLPPFSPLSDVAQRCYCGSSNCRGYLGQSKQATPLRTATTRSLRDVGSPREGGGGWRRRHTVRAENREDSMVSSVTHGGLSNQALRF